MYSFLSGLLPNECKSMGFWPGQFGIVIVTKTKRQVANKQFTEDTWHSPLVSRWAIATKTHQPSHHVLIIDRKPWTPYTVQIGPCRFKIISLLLQTLAKEEYLKNLYYSQIYWLVLQMEYCHGGHNIVIHRHFFKNLFSYYRN